MKPIKTPLTILLLFIALGALVSCEKYLDEMPDKSQAVISTMTDIKGFIKHPIMNAEYSYVPVITDDYVRFTPQNWLLLIQENVNTHLWQTNLDMSRDWEFAYSRIRNCNIVLSYINKINDPAATIAEKKLAEGEARFFRAYNWWELSQLFSPQPTVNNMNDLWGIALKTSPNVEDKTVRSTIKDMYDKIISDLKESIELLPGVRENKKDPSKVASYALLARVYLQVGRYDSSLRYADLCLKQYGELMDYNNINSSSNTPFKIINPEIIFQTVARFNSNFAGRQTMDSVFMNLYEENDLRLKVLYKKNGSLYSFKGNYDGSSLSTLFTGIAIDEIYLIRAESFARLGNIEPALSDLNTLLEKRWEAGTYVPYITNNPKQLLVKIIEERRKELVFRNLRFSDLRRLNSDNDFAQTVQRNIDGKIYSLLPNDLRYTFLIPQLVIDISGIQQNPR